MQDSKFSLESVFFFYYCYHKLINEQFFFLHFKDFSVKITGLRVALVKHCRLVNYNFVRLTYQVSYAMIEEFLYDLCLSSIIDTGTLERLQNKGI